MVGWTQGDREQAMGLPVTPVCDRATVVVSTSQLRFIDMFLRPLLQQVPTGRTAAPMRRPIALEKP